MYLVNLALHDFIRASAPDVRLSTYVDNWSGLGSTATEVLDASQQLRAFTDAWDLSLDERKLIFWSTDPVQRKRLRAAGVQTKLDFRELGAHMRFSRRHTNFSQAIRIRAMETRWSRLQASLAPYQRKVSVLRSAAWPRALHGISNVSIGDNLFAVLRSGAMRGLNAKAPGANPMLHLGLIEYPLADPGFVALRESFLDARRMAHKESFALALDSIAAGQTAAVPGPASILVARANSVGISWQLPSQAFCDTFGHLDPWTCSPQELDFRLCWAWQLCVAATLQHRKGFQGLVSVDPALSRRVVASLSPEDKAFIRVARNSAFYTQDALHHFEEGETPHCHHCGSLDSVRHRVYDCPHFAAARENLPIPSAELRDLEDYQALHAWGRRTPSLHDFYLHLNRPVDLLCTFADLQGAGPIDLFTDGTCVDPKQPETRVAAWAVVQGNVAAAPLVAAAGPLQGILQTSYRAEITAVIFACRLAQVAGRSARIWVDCQGVVSKARRLIARDWRPRASSCNYDLWVELADVLDQVGHAVQLCKVAAHDHEDGYDATTLWVLHHNHLADQAAEQANMRRGDDFWRTWSQLRHEVMAEEQRVKALIQLHTRVARIATRSRSAADTAMRAPVIEEPPQNYGMSLPLTSGAFPALEARFTSDFVVAVRDWYQRAFNSPAAKAFPVRWVSALQLFFDFVASAGFEPPQYSTTTRTWFLPGRLAAHEVITVDTTKKVRWFAQMLRGIARVSGGIYHAKETRPCSSTVLVKCLCVAVNVVPARLRIVDGLLARATRNGVFQSTKEWRQVSSPSLVAALR